MRATAGSDASSRFSGYLPCQSLPQPGVGADPRSIDDTVCCVASEGAGGHCRSPPIAGHLSRRSTARPTTVHHLRGLDSSGCVSSINLNRDRSPQRRERSHRSFPPTGRPRVHRRALSIEGDLPCRWPARNRSRLRGEMGRFVGTRRVSLLHPPRAKPWHLPYQARKKRFGDRYNRRHHAGRRAPVLQCVTEQRWRALYRPITGSRAIEYRGGLAEDWQGQDPAARCLWALCRQWPPGLCGGRGALLAVPFDEGRLEVTGAPVSLISGLLGQVSDIPDVVFSRTGVMVYLMADPRATELIWVGRDGGTQRWIPSSKETFSRSPCRQMAKGWL